MKKPKPRCENCGDVTVFPRTVDMEREKKGWCVPCFTYWKKNRRESSDGTEYWADQPSMYRRTPYTSR